MNAATRQKLQRPSNNCDIIGIAVLLPAAAGRRLGSKLLRDMVIEISYISHNLIVLVVRRSTMPPAHSTTVSWLAAQRRFVHHPPRLYARMLSTSGFVDDSDDVVFLYYWSTGGALLLYHCNIVHGLTPLLRSIGCILSQTMTGARTRRVHYGRGAGTRPAKIIAFT